jgi:hypothetical protein
MPSTSLIGELRRRIKDLRHTVNALTISTTDNAVTSALLEVTDGRLIFTPTGGTVHPFDVDLASPGYHTIGELARQLQRFAGITVEIGPDTNEDHLSVDVEEFGPVDVRTQGAALTTHQFSDWDLEQILTAAVRRHNPGMTITTLPPTESELVLTLAQAIVNRQLATSAVQRKGTAAEVNGLIAIAESFERTYGEDVERIKRAIQPVREAPSGKINEGDIMMGQMWRRSARTGYLAPRGQVPNPKPLLLHEAIEGDVEDENVRLRWQRADDAHFYSYEVWQDTQPDVQRAPEALSQTMLDVSPFSGAPYTNAYVARPTTAIRRFWTLGPSRGWAWAGVTSAVENSGQLATNFVVGELEPETEYFYRLFMFDLNSSVVASNVVRVRTKPLRCRFDRLALITPAMGAAGTVVTVYFDATRGAFTTSHRLVLGDKDVTASVAVVGPYEVTFVVPTYVQTAYHKHLVVASPTGLKDVLYNAFRVLT